MNLKILKFFKSKTYVHLIIFALCLFIFGAGQSKKSYAPNPCSQCNPIDCVLTIITIQNYHSTGRLTINNYITDQFVNFRLWLYGEFFVNNLLMAMMQMTEQLSAVGMHQMLAVGTMMDAKIQLEAQRDIQLLQLQAIKDYQPSQDFCAFGTNARSVSASESVGEYHKMALNKISLSRQLGVWNSPGGMSRFTDKNARWNLFVNNTCMVFNNNWDHDNPTFSGLEPLCGTSARSMRANRDIHYSRFVDPVRTLDGVDRAASLPVETFNFSGAGVSPIESDMIALSRNLYGHDILSRSVGNLEKDSVQHLYNSLRSVAAKRNVAENSFNSIVGMKVSGTANAAFTTDYLSSVMQNLGVSSSLDDIEDLMGVDPSYYAQMEILSKRIYQDPTFYANLYDKPENVQRVSVAMNAIELMLDRDMYESRLRKELAISVLLSSKLQDLYSDVQSNLEENIE